jgi:hypothetical protein
MLNDVEGRIALARAHADDLRRDLAAANRTSPDRIRARERLHRLVIGKTRPATSELPPTETARAQIAASRGRRGAPAS